MADQTSGTIGDNIAYTVKGNILTLTVDLSKPGEPSNSGKNILIASSGGAAAVAGVKVGLNVYKKKS